MIRITFPAGVYADFLAVTSAYGVPNKTIISANVPTSVDYISAVYDGALVVASLVPGTSVATALSDFPAGVVVASAYASLT